MVLNQQPILSRKVDWMLGILRQVAAYAQQLNISSLVAATLCQRHNVVDVIFPLDAHTTKCVSTLSSLSLKKSHDISFGNCKACAFDTGPSSRLMNAMLNKVLFPIPLLLSANLLRVRSHPFFMGLLSLLFVGVVIGKATGAFGIFVFFVAPMVLCLCRLGIFLSPLSGPFTFVCQPSGLLRIAGLIGCIICTGHPCEYRFDLSAPQVIMEGNLGSME